VYRVLNGNLAMDAIDRTYVRARRDYDAELKAAEALESRLGITERWEEDGPEYLQALREAQVAQFQRALDELARLVVARLFELEKANMRATGTLCVIMIDGCLPTAERLQNASTHCGSIAKAKVSDLDSLAKVQHARGCNGPAQESHLNAGNSKCSIPRRLHSPPRNRYGYFG
jgi:hypothetical protein